MHDVGLQAFWHSLATELADAAPAAAHAATANARGCRTTQRVNARAIPASQPVTTTRQRILLG